VDWCKATVEESADGRTFTLMRPHTCPTNPGVSGRDELIRDAKAKGRENLRTGARTISDQCKNDAFKKGDKEAGSTVSDLPRLINYDRAHARGENPTSLFFTPDPNHIPKGFFKAKVKVGDQRHFIFATDKQLQLLKNAKRLYVDGTFKLVREPFKQLFSIHVFMRKGTEIVQVPVCFVFMSRRQAKDYTRVFKRIKKLMGDICNVEEIVSDFEMGIWKGVVSVFPSAKIFGCSFHWTQAIFRKIKCLGLGRYYSRNENVRLLCRKLMSLNLLPTRYINRCFYSLEQQSRTLGIPLLSDLFQYVDNTWISSSFYSPTKLVCLFTTYPY